MTLADLALSTRMRKRPLGRAAVQRRYKNAHRAAFNAYRRTWRQQRREKGLPVT